MDHHRIPLAHEAWAEPLQGLVTWRFDPPSDILYLDACPAYPEQIGLETENDIVVYWNPSTGAVERVMILWVSRRQPGDAGIAMLPVDGPIRDLVLNFLRYAHAA